MVAYAMSDELVERKEDETDVATEPLVSLHEQVTGQVRAHGCRTHETRAENEERRERRRDEMLLQQELVAGLAVPMDVHRRTSSARRRRGCCGDRRRLRHTQHATN